MSKDLKVITKLWCRYKDRQIDEQNWWPLLKWRIHIYVNVLDISCIPPQIYSTHPLLVSSWLRPTSHRRNLTMLSLFLLGLQDRIWHLCMNYSDILGVIPMNHSASGVGGQWVNALLSSPIPPVNSEVHFLRFLWRPCGIGHS